VLYPVGCCAKLRTRQCSHSAFAVSASCCIGQRRLCRGWVASAGQRSTTLAF
jgi:hypothetical protein